MTITARPDVWAIVDSATVGGLTTQIQDLVLTTTAPTAMASLVTSLSLVIIDNYPAEQWGAISYDLGIHLQTGLLQELIARQGPGTPASDAPTTSDDSTSASGGAPPVAEEAPPVPPAPKFSGGVAPAPGATRS